MAIVKFHPIHLSALTNSRAPLKMKMPQQTPKLYIPSPSPPYRMDSASAYLHVLLTSQLLLQATKTYFEKENHTLQTLNPKNF